MDPAESLLHTLTKYCKQHKIDRTMTGSLGTRCDVYS